MNTQVLEPTSLRLQPADDYPAFDDKPMAETQVHILAMLHLIGALRYFFRKRQDVFVIGNMFIYYREDDRNARKAPDVMVAKGVDGTLVRRVYKLWEEGAAPCFIIEVTSKDTKREDLTSKATLYASWGVKEYFLFDPLHEYLDEQLQGYRLIRGEYVAMEPEEDSDLYSEELGIILSCQGSLLRIVDPESGEFVPTEEEALEKAEQAETRAELEATRAEQEAMRAEQEAMRADHEMKRAEAAEAEVARLRALLRKQDSE